MNNKKVRSTRPRYASELAKPLGSPKPAQIRQLQKSSLELKEEIYRLECTIAAAPAAMRRHRLATMDTLPAPERAFSPRRRQNARLPLQQQRLQRNRRLGVLIELVIVFTTLAAALGWMNQWFQWWN
jgi:hypothetical protein